MGCQFLCEVCHVPFTEVYLESERLFICSNLAKCLEIKEKQMICTFAIQIFHLGMLCYWYLSGISIFSENFLCGLTILICINFVIIPIHFISKQFFWNFGVNGKQSKKSDHFVFDISGAV